MNKGHIVLERLRDKPKKKCERNWNFGGMTKKIKDRKKGPKRLRVNKSLKKY